jgi:hypothetical protein
MDETTTVHESVEVARLDAAKFIINHFDRPDIDDGLDKPQVYEDALAFIASHLNSK